MKPDTENKNKRGRILLLLSIAKFSVIVFLIVGVPLIIYLQFPDILNEIGDLKQIREFLEDYKAISALVFVGLMVLQLIVSVLPGQPMEFAAGYVFTIPGAIILSMIGIIIGTFITFLIGKICGRDMIYMILGEERVGRFIENLNSKKATIAVFLIYLFPGIPKDVFAYAAGVSNMRMVPFVITSTIARMPALICSIVIGDMLYGDRYIAIAIIAGITLAIAVICLIFRKNVYGYVDWIYNKFFVRTG